MEKLLITDRSLLLENLEDKYSDKKGVYWNVQRKKWIARISIGGRKTHLGCFDNEEDAINKRMEWEDKLELENV